MPSEIPGFQQRRPSGSIKPDRQRQSNGHREREKETTFVGPTLSLQQQQQQQLGYVPLICLPLTSGDLLHLQSSDTYYMPAVFLFIYIYRSWREKRNGLPSTSLLFPPFLFLDIQVWRRKRTIDKTTRAYTFPSVVRQYIIDIIPIK